MNRVENGLIMVESLVADWTDIRRLVQVEKKITQFLSRLIKGVTSAKFHRLMFESYRLGS